MNNTKIPVFRLIAVVYLAYLLIDLVVKYLKGGAEAPSLGLLLLSVLVLGGGTVFVAILTWRDWKKSQEKDKEE
ncbi:MAG: hypothetical protein J6J43_06725 [Oscillospiraceae bacterium]|nr:hypothetical protein [Oscillospiraceae bacterium]